MTLRTRIVVAVLWIGSLALVGSLASGQTQRTDAGTVITGADIGFKPEGWSGAARTGTWVVRINGQWVETASVLRRVPATTR